jgi:hypothetical protein
MVSATDCRDFAAQCIDLANSSGDGRFQSILFRMASEWTGVAEFHEERELTLNSVP